MQEDSQDTTDFQKTLNYLKKQLVEEVNVLGLVGSR